MKYNLADTKQAEAAFSYLTTLVGKESMVNISKVSPNRTISQNSYLHLIIAAFGQHFGYTEEEAKTIYKQINKSLYYYTKKGRTFVKSSADLSKEDMAKSIDHFMQVSAENGCPLPLAINQDWLAQISNEKERAKYYL